MEKEQDAYGQELLALYKDPSTPEIVERDDNWLIYSDYNVRYFSDYSKWDKTEKKALKLAKGKILDIGCGAGRHSLYLQNKGFDVLGIDNSPGAVKVTRFRKVKKVKLLPVEYVNKLSPQKFDSVIMLGNNLSLLGSFKKGREILKKLYGITSADGQLIGEVSNPYGTSNPIHLKYQKRNRAKGRMSGQLKMRIRYKTMISPWFDYLMMSPEELIKIVKGTGWKIEKIMKTESTNYFVILKKQTSY